MNNTLLHTCKLYLKTLTMKKNEVLSLHLKFYFWLTITTTRSNNRTQEHKNVWL